MTIKKYTLLAIAFVLFQVASYAQSNDWGWDWKDSSKIPAKRLPQHNEFLNNNYPYPAQPRDQWELGISAGPSFIIGDINPKVGIGGSITARKAINHTFSLRAGYFGSINSGKPNTWGGIIGRNEYKNWRHSGALDLVVSLNPISYYRGNPKTNWYITAGYEFLATRVTYYDPVSGGFRTFYGYGYPNSQSGIIGTVGGDKHNGRNAWTMLHAASVGAGVAYKLNNKTNIKLEQRFTKILTGYDYLDAVKSGSSDDIYSFTSVGINFNMGKTSKRVQPLWWINPNNFAYNELNSPKHMKMPKVKLDDADDDGVTDQFDLEPNTPKGAKVDARGRALDTDGDGIPDYRDKEPLTPQKCFPVNNDGVGTCPEPACCKELRDVLNKLKQDLDNGTIGTRNNCTIDELPSIQFKGNAKLTKDAQSVLATVAQKMKENPNCKIKVIGYGTTTKSSQQASWEKVNAVINYLVEKQGIAENRFIFTYGQDGDSNTVDLQGTTEDGPNRVPAPHPNLKR